VRDLVGMRAAARALVALGARAALVTGGHLPSDAVDVLYDGHVLREFAARRVAVDATHGTGCVLSAAIAALLARGQPLADAVAAAKRFVRRAIETAAPIGHGARLLNLRLRPEET